MISLYRANISRWPGQTAASDQSLRGADGGGQEGEVEEHKYIAQFTDSLNLQ